MNEISNISIWTWFFFNIFVVFMLILDLFVLHKKSEVISVKAALLTSSLWIFLAFIFNIGIWIYLGKEKGVNFLTGYLIEKSLSIDNLFVFLLIFDYFQTPKKYQHKVLFWGILGALIMRAFFIFFGIALVDSFHWILYLFGAFLIYASIHMVYPREKKIDPENNYAIKLLKRFIPVSQNYDNDNFFTKRDGIRYATPLFITLLVLETTDIIFAIDSIPAIMAITLDPFIIYTSNIFAIMGLRSLYFALSGVMSLFHFLKYGLASILAFIGLKMLLATYIDIPIGIALGFIVIALGISVGASILYPIKTTPKSDNS